MSEISVSEINALVKLLDDNDEEIYQHVRDKILGYGKEVLPILESLFLEEVNPLQIHLINEIIEEIFFSELKTNLMIWAASGGKDLFEGAFYSAQFRFPNLERDTLNIQIEKIKLEVWLSLHFQQAPHDKVRVLNHVMFNTFHLKSNVEEYHNIENSFINKVLETGNGNPVSLCIIYSIIAQRLNIPIFGVNLPQHFVLAYIDDTGFEDLNVKGIDYLDYNGLKGDIMFYINPFSKGAIFSRNHIDSFLKQLNIEPKPYYFLPCSNVDIIIRVFRNLQYSYSIIEDSVRTAKITDIIALLEPFSSKVL